jgi:hypothetical protein
MKILVILLLFIICSCTKFWENILVNGKVINPVTAKGIANVKIELQKKTTFEYATGFKAVKTVYTDNDGNFEIRHLGSLKQYYIRCQYTEVYYPIGWFVDGEKKISDFIKINKGKDFYAEYKMLPYGNYKYSINNVNCFNETDTLHVNMYHEFIENYQNYNNPMNYLGCFSYFGESFLKVPMGKYYYTGEVIKNGIKTPFYTEIYVEEKGFHDWVIEY